MDKWHEMDKPAKLALLTKLGIDEGRSASQIASTVGCSRNSIIGFAHRNHIQLHGTAEPPTPSPVKRAFNAFVRTALPVRRKGERKPPRLEVDTRGVTKSAAWAPIPETRPRALSECGDKECSWPLFVDGQPKLFCGEPNEDKKPYCPAHCRLAYSGGRRDVAA